MKTFANLLTLITLSLAIACGGKSPPVRSPTPPQQPDTTATEVEPASAEEVAEPEPTPPAPDPREELDALLEEIVQKTTAIRQTPWGKWADGVAELGTYDTQLAGFATSVPSEADRIKQIRDTVGKLADAVKRKNKKKANQALGQLETALTVE